MRMRMRGNDVIAVFIVTISILHLLIQHAPANNKLDNFFQKTQPRNEQRR